MLSNCGIHKHIVTEKKVVSVYALFIDSTPKKNRCLTADFFRPTACADLPAPLYKESNGYRMKS